MSSHLACTPSMSGSAPSHVRSLPSFQNCLNCATVFLIKTTNRNHLYFSAKSCNITAFGKILSNCMSIITKFIIPNVEMPEDVEKLKVACRGNKEFQNCILESGSQVCPHTNFRDKETTAKLTNGLFNKYSWTCLKEGKLCTSQETRSAFDSCSDIISNKILQNINIHNRSQLQSSCKGLKEYVECMNVTMTAHCPVDVSLGRISTSNLTSEVETRYNWTCSMQSTNCTPESMKAIVTKCSFILEGAVLPIVQAPVYEMKLRQACKQFRHYQSCIVNEGKRICPNDDIDDANVLADITHGNFNKYNWVCNVNLFNCTPENFELEHGRCQQILELKVIPSLVLPSSKDIIDIACVGNKKYQDCIIYHGNNLCPEIEFDLKFLNKITKNLFNKYNWTCSDNMEYISIRSVSSENPYQYAMKKASMKYPT
ncbi:uncharacterized protein ISCGN_000598 [Ixodes scapularis]